ncbi:DUF6216 family protein [Mannheimia bovis]|uniref:Uncharacterized protein n=1 Tax=Mannheimia bovis TaxID=2770636 RepID=A0A7H1C0Y2_9PAST|nr:DUF6216 family protein [Mannheimia bovis]QNS14637.1 hypothetical protein ICJ55_07715 [Mannheimia bovis]
MNKISDLLSITEKYSHILYYAFIAVLILILYFVFTYRAKSSFSLIHRLLILLIGNDKNYKKDNELINDIMEIERFNFYYKTNAICLRQKQEFESWVRKYELDYKLLSKLKNNFDIQELKVINVPSKNKFITLLIVYLLTLSLSLITMPFMINNTTGESLLIQLKSNQQYYWLKDDYVRKFNWKEIFSLSHSSEKYTHCQFIEENHSSDDINTICKIILDKKNNEYIKSSINTQQNLFIMIIVIIAVILFQWLSYIYSLGNRLDADRMIKKKIKQRL